MLLNVPVGPVKSMLIGVILALAGGKAEQSGCYSLSMEFDSGGEFQSGLAR